MAVSRRMAEHAVDLLNRALYEDCEAITNLLTYRVRCNDRLADDPTIPVSTRPRDKGVTALGVINGIFCDDGDDPPIVAVFDEETGMILSFRMRGSDGEE